MVSTTPKGIVHIDGKTDVELLPEYEEQDGERRADVTYDDLGGMRDTIDALREMVELPLRYPELFQRLGVDPPKGVLLHGPPGTGKTLLARAVANESAAKFFLINGPEIMGSAYGESERHLREIFEQASQAAPSIIFIDEIDSIAPKRGQVTGEAEKRLVAQLLTLMDGIEPRQNLVVIAATNRPEAIDEALRRPGRFDREIVVGVPDEPRAARDPRHPHPRHAAGGGRRSRRARAPDLRLRRRRSRGAGARGGDGGGAADHAEAQPRGRGRSRPRCSTTLSVEPRAISTNALKRVQPSAMREVMVEAPTIGWDDIGGLDAPRERLREGVELPLKHPEAFRRLGIRPAKGFLLYGPPGTGKTLLAKAVAREAQANFIATKSSDLLSKWYGESEQQIARLFARARQVAPTIIFIDELDSLVPARGGGLGEPQVTERVVNTILAEMDGLEELQNVVVIGATNRPNLIDPALLRPGRFDELVYVRYARRGRPRAASSRIHTRGHAACQGRRSRRARQADRPLHRRRSRGPGAPRRPDRASPRARYAAR